MQIFNSPSEAQQFTLNLKKKEKTISFVPTMGALHEGHLELMREARKNADIMAVSIFINPIQFSPNEDLNKYPRELESDLKKVENVGTDIVFLPTPATMYPEGFQTKIDAEEVTKFLCGASRPTHFKGVVTVVAKLFNIIQPDISFFGEKDYQQLVAIKRMVSDLNFPIKIVGVPIVREKDGLAMSSRNRYLSKEEREAAVSISKSLKIASKMVENGEKDAKKIINTVKNEILSTKMAKIDYVSICDPTTLKEVQIIDGPSRIFAAVYFGKTRLIDNCQLI